MTLSLTKFPFRAATKFPFRAQPRLRVLLAAVFVFALLAVTRIPLAPRYLYHFDSVNFALALDDFNPSKHQPQPPGYPMFVALMRIVHLAIPDAQQVLLASGLLLATAAALLIGRLAMEMFGPDAAVLAVALFVMNPPCWFGGITNQVRISLAFCSAGVALLAWKALQRPEQPWRLYAAFAALGIGAGFRPALGALLVPLLLWVWWRAGRSLPRLLACAGVALVSMAPWIAATAISVGGLREWLALLWTYSNDQFHGTSAVFGAHAASAKTMLSQAVAWNGIGVLSWIWAVPLVRPKWRDPKWRKRASFLAVWFVPIFVFSAVIHIGDPDQALGSISVLCVVGGAVLSALLVRMRSRRVAALAVLVGTVNAVLFFLPPGRLARASGYRAMDFVDDRTRDVFDSIRLLKKGAPVTVVHYRGIVSWRHLSYYFPDDYVMYLAPDSGEYSWTLLHKQTVSASRQPHKLPGPGRAILIAPTENPVDLILQGWTRHGPVYFRDLKPAAQVTVGPYHLAQPDKL